ncbi:ABC transporter ATP-binding protein [Alkalicoccus daliensis]|uniref:Quaternary amine transport ATP-binding protein n=1 Tax=Alkalicoccus daliensis TaxID=745820 RepID=A0A1H0AGZ2_9BACI|nr:ABC transporter ATP-binding protein [Alkalicoccus daliensis]SDN32591.1 osmoprotectant transport system ATP-binding protein [Alkalicoccus daliensis]
MIEFDQVTKQFPDGTKAVNNINFRVKEGEFFVLIGPSGCGKTTTLKMINRLIDASEGTIKINDENILSKNLHKLRWEIGYVLQQIALFPHMTIAENIAIVPELKKWSKSDTNARIDELLEMVGLHPGTYRDRLPSELSGGQQQRIGVVRALAGNPDILLMDEPFSALDPLSRDQLQQDVGDLQKQIKKTIVFVTHDINEALLLADRIAIMQEGSIVQVDTPENILDHPANDFVRSFIGNKTNPWKETVEKVMSETDAPGAPVIPHTATLTKAVDQLKASEKDVLRVLNRNEAVGSISYKQIVHYLSDFEASVKEEVQK